MRAKKPQGLRDECRVIWEEDISGLDYVREIVTSAPTRRRPVRWHGPGRRVGYTILAADARNDGSPGSFRRRVFFLKDGDRDTDPDGAYSFGAPIEAVDPRTVKPNRRGKLTARAWNSPFGVVIPLRRTA